MGIGDKEEIKELNVAAHSENSSFVKPKLNTKWIELRVNKQKLNKANIFCQKKK